MGRIRKITVEVPADLLRKAQKQSGEGVTGTVRQGLELLAAAEAYRNVAALRELAVDHRIALIRNDRDFGHYTRRQLSETMKAAGARWNHSRSRG